MDITSLKEFLALAETQNFWEASDLLFMNESTLSKHIKKLETELSVPLFDRNTRRVSLTSYGESLIPYAKSIVEQARQFQEELAKQIQTESQTLILGVIPSMVQYRITDILVDFRKKHPEKNVQILEGDTNDLLEALIHRKCSLAFLRDSSLHPIDPELFEKIPYTKDRLCVLLPASHPLASRHNISMMELASEDFVVLNRETLLHQIFTSLCELAGFNPRIAIECKRLDSIFDLVAQHMGISLLTDKHFSACLGVHVRNDLVIIPLEPEMYSLTYLCYLKNAPLNATAREMLQYMKDTKQVLKMGVCKERDLC